MASKVNKKNTLTIQGTLDLTDDEIKVEIEGFDEPQLLSDLAEEFDGKDVKITIAYGEEL